MCLSYDDTGLSAFWFGKAGMLRIDPKNREQSAQQMVALHNARAALEAEFLAEVALAKGDKIGFRTWREIAGLIRYMQSHNQMPIGDT